MMNLDAALKALGDPRGDFAHVKMMHAVRKAFRAYHGEPVEPPKPEHSCKTCQHLECPQDEPPCAGCWFINTNHRPHWEPKEPKPAQDYKLEAGCKFVSLWPHVPREAAFIMAAHVIDTEGCVWLRVVATKVTEPATPEVGDYVLAKGAFDELLGTIEYIDPDDRLAYQVRAAWYSRRAIIILAKARHVKQEQG